MGVWAKKQHIFDETYPESPSKLFSKCSRQHSDARCFIIEKTIFIILLGFWAKISTVLSELPCRFWQPLFEEWYNFGRNISFLQLFAISEREFFKLRAKNLGWLVKTACYMCREMFWLETIFLKDFPSGN